MQKSQHIWTNYQMNSIWLIHLGPGIKFSRIFFSTSNALAAFSKIRVRLWSQRKITHISPKHICLPSILGRIWSANPIHCHFVCIKKIFIDFIDLQKFRIYFFFAWAKWLTDFQLIMIYLKISNLIPFISCSTFRKNL